MELKPGIVVQLKVARQSDFGYFLANENNPNNVEDVLLHNRQITKAIEIGEIIEVFLYHDHQGRLTATMEKPIISLGKFAWLKVVAINERDGVFLYNGIDRDLFLSVDDLGTDRSLWPKVDDKIPVSLAYDKKGRLIGKLLRRKELEETAVHAPKTILNTNVTGTIYALAEKGVFVMTEARYTAFLHFKEANEQLHLGKVVTGRVTFVRDDGKINISLQPKAHERRFEDADTIYQFLLKREGGMPYNDQSDPTIIKQKFAMSKGAFKRALGKLLKEGKIYQKDGWTYKKE